VQITCICETPRPTTAAAASTAHASPHHRRSRPTHAPRCWRRTVVHHRVRLPRRRAKRRWLCGARPERTCVAHRRRRTALRHAARTARTARTGERRAARRTARHRHRTAWPAAHLPHGRRHVAWTAHASRWAAHRTTTRKRRVHRLTKLT
jgi:hypothetical protein